MKLIFHILFCLFSLPAFCQLKMGIQVGYNHSTFAGSDIHIPPVEDYYYHASSMPAFNIGFIASLPLAKRVSLQPSILLSEKGAKEESVSGYYWSLYSGHLRGYYAHLPLQVMYSLLNKKQWHVSVGAGGFVSKGIWGISKGSFRIPDSIGSAPKNNLNSKINFTNHLDDQIPDFRNAKSWDVGFTVAATAGWRSWQLKASYDFGTVKVIDLSNHRTSIFSLSAGYYFMEKKGNQTKNCK